MCNVYNIRRFVPIIYFVLSTVSSNAILIIAWAFARCFSSKNRRMKDLLLRLYELLETFRTDHRLINRLNGYRINDGIVCYVSP